mmetsp:Transcript_52004/g.114079  ORF Transcript_52004/g.114079 Transcript_52004/m.114079 type:complete len:225 (+) Transcript_52004:841-1515(+)
MLLAVRSSTSALNFSTCEVFSSRVCALVASSVEHHPCCSASALASSSNFVMRPSIIFFTFLKGSSAAWVAAKARARLPRSLARCCKKVTTCATNSAPCCDDRSCSSTWCCFASFFPCICSSLGRCLSAAPFTASLDKISMAFFTASISPDRVVCRCSKASALLEHMLRVSWRYAESSSNMPFVRWRSPSSSAFLRDVFCLSTLFVSTSCSPCSMLSANAWEVFS